MFRFSNPAFRYLLLFVVLLLLSWMYSYVEILPLRPGSVHQWRQADCLSLADNYYQGNWNLFQPALNILFSDNETSGKSAGEFPLLYYIVAILWRLFGRHEFIFRLVTIAISFTGMFALFKLSFGILKDYFWALCSVIFLFSSPIFVFYTNNFLINVPAFSVMLIAVWYFYRFWKSSQNKFLYLSMGFFLLVGLLKISTLLCFVAIGFIYLSDVSGRIRLKTEGPVFRQPLKQILPFVAVLAGTALWYLYVRHYNKIHGGVYTLNYIQSYWVSSKEQIASSLKSLKNFIVFQVISIPSFIYLFLCLIYLGLHFRKLAGIWKVVLPLLLFGYFVFIMLFFYSLDCHDYYHVDFLIIPLAINLAFLHYLRVNENALFQSSLLKLFFGAFMLYNVLYCANNMQMRYWGYTEKNLYCRQLMAPKIDLEAWGYTKWAYGNGAYETVTPVLRKMGIKREDAVLCPEDPSYSISLYLMDQLGWTNPGSILDSSAVSDRIAHGAKYLMILDTATLRMPFIRSYVGHELMQYQKLHVYDLRPYSKSLH
jgi:hypothetical protein